MFCGMLIRERQGKQTVAESQKVRTGVRVRRVKTGRENKHDKKGLEFFFFLLGWINRPRDSTG